LKDFLQIILSLFKDDEALAELFKMVGNCNKEPRKTATESPKLAGTIVQPAARHTNSVVEKTINQVSQRKRTSKEFQINAQI